MGNTTSSTSVSKREHHRLSKPKTNSNSPAESPVANKLLHGNSLSALNYDDIHNESVVWSSAGDCRSKESARQALRNELCGTRGSDGSASDRADDHLGDLALNLRDRLNTLSRNGSNASHLASHRSSAVRLSPAQTEGQANDVKVEDAVRILRELRKVASPDDLLALQQALEPDRSPKQSPSTATIRNSPAPNGSTTSLIRRRSLATPGLATRKSTTEVLRKPVKASEGQHRDSKVWQLNEFGTSPLTRLASMDVSDKSEKPNAPRSETPADMEQLGSFQLGSLVITNGAASPAPSILTRSVAHRQSTPDLHREDDYYFTADEDRASIEMVRESRPQIMKPHRSFANLASDPEAFYRTAPWTSRTRGCDSPLKNGSTAAHDVDDDIADEELAPPPPITPYRASRNGSAQHLADDYLSDLAPGPFASDLPVSSDEGIEADMVAANDHDCVESMAPLNPTLDHRGEALHHLEGLISASHRQRNVREIASTDESPEPKLIRPRQTKADSGYSSGHSDLQPEDSSPTMLRRDNSRTRRDDTVDIGTPKASKLYDCDNVTDPLDQSDLSSTLRINKHREKMADKKVKKSKSWRRFSSGSSLSPGSQVAAPAAHSSQMEKRSTPNLKKLQKKRPGYLNPPIVSTLPVVDGNIPTIPDHLTRNFENRMSVSPGMDCLEHTFASVSHVDATREETSTPVMFTPIEFPSWDTPILQEKVHRRSSAGSRPPTPPIHRHPLRKFESTDSTNFDHLSKQDEYLSPTITDFGTVAESLGASPYDAAWSHAPIEARRVSTSRTHPHQLGRSLSRPKSMHNMSDADASKFARERSFDRAAAATVVDAVNTPTRPRGRSRPRSYYDRKAEEKEHLAMKGLRPKSMYHEAPPVPRKYENRSETKESTKPLTAILREQRDALKPVRKDSHQSPDRPSLDREQSWSEAQRVWALRRQAVGEAVSGHIRPTLPRAQTDRSNSRSPDKTRPESATGNGLYDRYGGGLAYGYEKGVGLGGSAGTRAAENQTSRKGLHLSYTHGVDLSDIPVFLHSQS